MVEEFLNVVLERSESVYYTILVLNTVSIIILHKNYSENTLVRIH